jgi:hypothetical protein
LREVVRLVWGLKPGANRYGKFKVYAEIAVIAALAFRGLTPRLDACALVAFIAATALAAASLLAQGWSVRRSVKDRKP